MLEDHNADEPHHIRLYQYLFLLYNQLKPIPFLQQNRDYMHNSNGVKV